MQIVNLLNLDYPTETGMRLCEEVLATLAALLKDNEASRQRLKADVGYDTLLNVLLSRSGTGGPSQGILTQVACLALEVGVKPALAMQSIPVACILSEISGPIDPAGCSVPCKLPQ